MTEEALARALDRLVPSVVAQADWDDVLARASAPIPLHRNRRLWYALAAAAVLLALLVSPAFGLGHRLVDIFTGSPAPKPVKRELSFGTNISDEKIGELMHQRVDSRVRLGKARGLMEVSTPVGALRIWGAPTSDGGLCTYMLLAGAAHGWLTCDTPSNHDDEMFLGVADARTAGGRTVRFVSGQAGEGIASVELRLADGSALPVKIVRPFFFHVLQPGQQPDALVGRDAAGNSAGEISVHMASPPRGVLPPRLPIGPSHEMLALQTKIGPATFSRAPGPDGDHCWIVHTPESDLIACRPVSKPVEFDYAPYYDHAQTHFVVFLSGFVRRDVRSLELRFEDGESVAIDLLTDDYFFHQLSNRNWKRGHRPTFLVARDKDGKVLSRRRVE